MHYVLFLLVLGSSFLHAESDVELKIPSLCIDDDYNPLAEDEIKILDKLISVEEIRLVKQKHIREMMRLFQKQKEEFIAGNQSQKHAFAMVSNARNILTEIKEDHLSYLFPVEYLEELVFFSSIAAKSAPVRPEMTK